LPFIFFSQRARTSNAPGWIPNQNPPRALELSDEILRNFPFLRNRIARASPKPNSFWFPPGLGRRGNRPSTTPRSSPLGHRGGRPRTVFAPGPPNPKAGKKPITSGVGTNAPPPSLGSRIGQERRHARSLKPPGHSGPILVFGQTPPRRAPRHQHRPPPCAPCPGLPEVRFKGGPFQFPFSPMRSGQLKTPLPPSPWNPSPRRSPAATKKIGQFAP